MKLWSLYQFYAQNQQFVFNGKSISRYTTHPQSWNLLIQNTAYLFLSDFDNLDIWCSKSFCTRTQFPCFLWPLITFTANFDTDLSACRRESAAQIKFHALLDLGQTLTHFTRKTAQLQRPERQWQVRVHWSCPFQVNKCGETKSEVVAENSFTYPAVENFSHLKYYENLLH